MDPGSAIGAGLVALSSLLGALLGVAAGGGLLRLLLGLVRPRRGRTPARKTAKSPCGALPATTD